jgi:hypothetical protein
MMKHYTFTRGLSYANVVAASERVAWTVDGVYRDRRFDASAPIVPSSWVGAEGLGFLDDEDRLVLNHCRAFSYVHLLGNFEEFAPPHLAGTAAAAWHDERARLRALFRFGEEEMKHQELFQRAERVLEASCGYPFGRYFDDTGIRVAELTRAMLEHGSLARFLIVLALEWGTQRHYVESVRDADGSDALYADLLKAHWVEEAQHIKVDALEIAAAAEAMSAPALSAAFDDLLAIGGLVDVVFAGQAAMEVETLARVSGRALADEESAALRRALHDSLGGIMAGVGLGHPSFVLLARELSPAGAAKLGIA